MAKSLAGIKFDQPSDQPSAFLTMYACILSWTCPQPMFKRLFSVRLNFAIQSGAPGAMCVSEVNSVIQDNVSSLPPYR